MKKHQRDIRGVLQIFEHFYWAAMAHLGVGVLVTYTHNRKPNLTGGENSSKGSDIQRERERERERRALCQLPGSTQHGHLQGLGDILPSG